MSGTGLQKIRVVYLVGQLGMGGSECQLYLLLKNMDRARFEPLVVVFNDSPNKTYQEGLQEAGVEVMQAPESHRTVAGRALWLFGYLRRVRPDVIHSWTVHDNPYAGLVGVAARVPIRWGSLRGSIHLAGFRSLSPLLRRLSLRSVTRLVVNSVAIRRELEATGYPSSKLILLTNCVEPASGGRAAVDLSDFGIEPHHRVIGNVGNLNPVKNHLMFVRSMAQVLPLHEDVRAVIVGQTIASAPGVEERLRREIRQLGLTARLTMIGFRSDVAALMRRFQVLCLTSSSEGLPNVILEAMAAQTPVVATNVGGVPELVGDGSTGFLVPFGDEQTFAARVQQILDSEELGNRLGRAGKLRAEQFHRCDLVARTLEDLYETVRKTAGTKTWASRSPGRKSAP